MQNKWFFYFGYVRIQLDPKDLKGCVTLLRKENIIAHFLADGRVDISIFHWKRAKRILRDKIVFNEQNIGGAFSVLSFLKKHIMALVAVLLFLSVYVILSFFVFDVRVEGNACFTSEEICEELTECGLYVGAKWKTLSFSEIESKMLSISDRVAWLNIYRRGGVAYVTVKEKERAKDKEIPSGYANIISNFDGVIEDISVKNGSASVAVGQSVKKGELLISSFDSQGLPTYAQGEVYARVYGTFSISVPRLDTESVKREYIPIKKSVKFFDFLINIFKKYGNLPKEYVIIEDRRRILLSKDKPLPITLLDTYALVETKEKVMRSDEELVAIAKEAHEGALLSYLSSGEIVFVRTRGEFTEDGYRMESEICMLTQIGVTVPLPTE